jgi:HEAT repeat protein
MLRASLLLMMVIGVMACGTDVRNQQATANTSPTPSVSVSPTVSVASSEKFDLADALSQLSSPDSQQRVNARGMLLSYAKDSNRRRQIIEGLIASMDKPNLDFVSNQSDYYLWLEGSKILGDLKATQSLDLLIAHLDLNNGSFGASMNHQPAIPGIIEMGTVAVPKLAEALRHNKNRDIRQAAAFCLAGIGGKSATGTLKDSLKSESDACVRKMIELSLDVDAKAAKAARRNASYADIEAEDNARWERLLAFWCK